MRRNTNGHYRQLIQSHKWQKLRRDIITANPVCQDCGLQPAQEVHHVTPCETATTRDEMARLMFDRSNVRALCHSCHIAAHVALGRSGSAAQKRLTSAKIAAFNARYYGDTDV